MNVAILMDPPEGLKPAKDSTIALIQSAGLRGIGTACVLPNGMFLHDGAVFVEACAIHAVPGGQPWYRRDDPSILPLNTFDLVLMRTDPPFDAEYLYATHLLSLAEASGVRVLNRPQALRDANEKLFAQHFPSRCPPTLVTSRIDWLQAFASEQGDIIVKPLDAMAGQEVFRIRADDPNRNALLETMTRRGRRTIMAQRYLPEVRDGDKRILMINGDPIPHVLARIPAEGETRANLAAGGRPEVRPLSLSDLAICHEVGPVLREMGLFFVGLDVIGDRLTEINVTSPTGIREIEQATGMDVAGRFWDALS